MSACLLTNKHEPNFVRVQSTETRDQKPTLRSAKRAEVKRVQHCKTQPSVTRGARFRLVPGAWRLGAWCLEITAAPSKSKSACNLRANSYIHRYMHTCIMHRIMHAPGTWHLAHLGIHTYIIASYMHHASHHASHVCVCVHVCMCACDRAS